MFKKTLPLLIRLETQIRLNLPSLCWISFFISAPRSFNFCKKMPYGRKVSCNVNVKNAGGKNIQCFGKH